MFVLFDVNASIMFWQMSSGQHIVFTVGICVGLRARVHK